ncbi:MAG TPA: AAA family ATPase [Jatrophihabitans sp.]|jgi:NadR type nicotinamide-nucleotide adenylyltransferase|uniref:AAA family ATPase n=1 Tax=Jatrophihabitans sp. TaxID=1932789 RepID=UPI002F11A882
MTAFAHGFVLGKFYPPHEGHHLLVRTAAAQCDQVTVLVMSSQGESLPLTDRVAWMRAVHGETPQVTVLGVVCDCPLDLGSEVVWEAQVAVMRAALRNAGRPAVDAVFSSESYGDELAARLGGKHVSVDPARVQMPVSGTACRADLAAMWTRLHPVVRQGLAARVVVVGAESTGTTTVSHALAQRFRDRGGVWASTGWVPEFGRDFTVRKWDEAKERARAAGRPEPEMTELVWTADDFALIAARQTALENAAAAASSPLLVCDTDAFATRVWEYRYLGAGSSGSHEAANEALPRRDVYLLTDHRGVPFAQDGLRDGEHIRADMTGWFVEALTAAGHSWVLLSGTLEERIDLATRVVNQMLVLRSTFAGPLPWAAASSTNPSTTPELTA